MNSEKKATVSLVLGIISVIPIIIIEFAAKITLYMGPTPVIVPFIYFLIDPLIALLGLILGIKGIKSTKRIFSIIGILFSLIGLVVPIIYFLS